MQTVNYEVDLKGSHNQHNKVNKSPKLTLLISIPLISPQRCPRAKEREEKRKEKVPSA